MTKCPKCKRVADRLARDWDCLEKRKLGYGDDDSLAFCSCCRWFIKQTRRRLDSLSFIW